MEVFSCNSTSQGSKNCYCNRKLNKENVILAQIRFEFEDSKQAKYS